MKENRFKILLPMAAMMLLLLSSCKSIFDDYPKEEQATILLSIDGATTRAGNLFADDALIGKLRIIVFTSGALEINEVFESGNANFDNPFRVTVATGTKKVYIIANETSGLTTSLTDASLTETGLKAIMANDIASGLNTPLVMAGEIIDVALLTAGLHNATVTLKRVAAKINLGFMKGTATDNVQITKVSLLKNTGKSTLWEGSTLSGTQSYWSHTVSNLMNLTGTLQDYLTVYVYENLGNSVNNKTNATQLEVEATYNGLPSIYRVYVNENISAVVNPGDPNSSVTNPDDHLYNIKRNYEYNIKGTISALGDFQGLTILTAVQPWTGENKTYFVGYGYTVEVDGDKVTVSNHDEDCPPHLINLKALNGLTFSDGDTEKSFEETAAGVIKEFTLSAEPTTGDYLEVWYNGVLVNTFTK